jgi:hypothetical protein
MSIEDRMTIDERLNVAIAHSQHQLVIKSDFLNFFR